MTSDTSRKMFVMTGSCPSKPLPPAPPHDRTPQPWLVLVLVCMAQFMVVLDATIVNVALPSIQADLEMSDADLVDGFHVAYLGSAILVAAASMLLLLLLRRQDVVAVSAGELATEPAAA